MELKKDDLRTSSTRSPSPARSSPRTPATSTSTRSPRRPSGRRSARHALLLARQCDAPARDRARRKDRRNRARHRRMRSPRRSARSASLVGVCHGFVGNRMLAERQREASKLILEGAMPWDVDRVITDFGMPMGPFAMSDLAGLDIGWSAIRRSAADPRDPVRGRPPGAEDRHRLLRLRRGAQRQAFGRCREISSIAASKGIA